MKIKVVAVVEVAMIKLISDNNCGNNFYIITTDYD